MTSTVDVHGYPTQPHSNEGSAGTASAADSTKPTSIKDTNIMVLLQFAHRILSERQLGLGRYNRAKESLAYISLCEVRDRVLAVAPGPTVHGVLAGWDTQACTDQLNKLVEITRATGGRWHGSEDCLHIVTIMLHAKHYPDDVPEMAQIHAKVVAGNAKDAAVKKEDQRRKLNSGDDCAICLELLRVGENVERVQCKGVATPREHAPLCTLPCSHRFHAECMATLRESCENKVCPACRADLPPPAGDLFGEALLLHVAMKDAVATRADGSWCLASQQDKESAAEVVRLYTGASEQGHTTAMLYLGILICEGHGVSKNIAKGESMIRKAAGHGNVDAQRQLGYILLEDDRCVVANIEEAVEWYRKAAEHGCAEAQQNMGAFNAGACGWTRNMKESVRWYRKAAAQNNQKAMLVMGDVYTAGAAQTTVKRDYSEALRWYFKAAAEGNPDAQNDIDVVLAMKRSENETGVSVPGAFAHVIMTTAGLPGLGALDGAHGLVLRFVASSRKCLVRIQPSTEDVSCLAINILRAS